MYIIMKIAGNDFTDKRNTINSIVKPIDVKNRFCTHCHVKLINNPFNKIGEKYVFKCPQCGVISYNLANTEPQQQLTTTFPTVDITRADYNDKPKNIMQNVKDRLSRSEYFILKNLQDKAHTNGENDPQLKFLKQNNKIRITSVDYYSRDDE
jgi:predicted RNA-binding Zn-ribbon protein involved in translation (DUF1610 family)